jgi:hypothetical protein
MAKYNTFVVQQTKGGKAVLVTSSARKVKKLLQPGLRVEVWSQNKRVETVYSRNREQLNKYTAAEKEYVRNKQKAAELRNKRRRTRT